MPSESSRFVLTLSCRDTKGIVAAVSGFLLERDCNIVDSAQFGDVASGLFFMRVVFDGQSGLEALREAFAPTAARFGFDFHMADLSVRPRVLIMVSKFGHCLNDLLFRASIGALPVDIRAIASNHPDMRRHADAAGIAYHLLPVTRDTKLQQEAEILRLFASEQCELLVLARYMQVLSNDLCARLSGRIINIHHSFLPSFKGALPYHQAHERGVKLIGATAHYVTADLDEGPIIEQETVRVDHRGSPEDYVTAGRDVETVVLARAVQWHAERRILPHGGKTIVFR